MTNFDELVKFIRTYGPGMFKKSDDYLRRDLEWYHSKSYILVIRDKEGIIAVFTGYPIKNLNEIAETIWPQEDRQGKYFYGTIGVIHPLYRGRKIMWHVFNYIKEQVPTLEYVYFTDAQNNFEPTIKYIGDLKNGIRRRRFTSPTSSTSTPSGSNINA